MAKIAFISLLDPKDKKSWSGTLYSELHELRKYHEVVTIQAVFSPMLIKIVRFRERIKYILTGKTYIPEFSSRLLSKKCASQVNKKLKGNSYDVVFGPAISTVLPYIKTDSPIIYMSDAVFALMVGYYFKNMNYKNQLNGNWFEQQSLNMCDAAIFASDWAKQGAVENYHIDETKVYTIPLGANVNENNYILERHVSDTVRLIFIGVDWKRKGGDIAINTTYVLNKMRIGKKFELDVIGGKPEYSVDDKVIHLQGFIDKNSKKEMDKFQKLIASAHMLILPTQAECAGMAFSEAAAYGLPCITCKTGGVGSYVHSGINGYTLLPGASAEDYAKVIAGIVLDDAKYNELCKNAVELSKSELNWEVWGKRANAVIEEVIGIRNNL